MAVFDPKALVTTIKARKALDKKSNVTFRLTDKVVQDFKSKCGLAGVGTGEVLEEMMKAFIESQSASQENIRELDL